MKTKSKPTTKSITKKFIRETVRQVIDNNLIDVPFDVFDVERMNGLLGTNYQGFVRKRNPVFTSDPRHMYWIDGGKSESFSWLGCITAITPEQRIRRAMRYSVYPDTEEFKWGMEPQECVRCGSNEHIQTDHVDPPFEAIVRAYLEEHSAPDIIDGFGGVGDVFKDMDVEAEWIEFHAQRAVYQLLCRSCNASKGNRA